MTWSLHAKGTPEGVKRSLTEQKGAHAPSPEEAAIIETVRAALLAMVKSLPATQEHVLMIVAASASGHGGAVAECRFATEHLVV